MNAARKTGPFSGFIRWHLEWERSFIFEAREPLCLKRPKPGSLDQPVQNKHALLSVGQLPDLQAARQRRPGGNLQIRILEINVRVKQKEVPTQSGQVSLTVHG